MPSPLPEQKSMKTQVLSWDQGTHEPFEDANPKGDQGRIGHHPQKHWIDASLGEGMSILALNFERKEMQEWINPPIGDVKDHKWEPTQAVAQALWKWCKNHRRGEWTKMVRDGDQHTLTIYGSSKGHLRRGEAWSGQKQSPFRKNGPMWMAGQNRM
jgi:hypothetical protein